MSLNKVQEIERAIGTLTPQEREDLYMWLDVQPHSIDARIQGDLSAGHLDRAIRRALEDEERGRVQSL